MTGVLVASGLSPATGWFNNFLWWKTRADGRLPFRPAFHLLRLRNVVWSSHASRSSDGPLGQPAAVKKFLHRILPSPLLQPSLNAGFLALLAWFVIALPFQAFGEILLKPVGRRALRVFAWHALVVVVRVLVVFAVIEVLH